MEDPTLALYLFTAFSKAKEVAFRSIQESPQGWRHRACSYGLGVPERKSIEAFLRYHFTRGPSFRRIAIEKLFRPVAMERNMDPQ
jgi:hypothetical protein